jgi:hypothetical protein
MALVAAAVLVASCGGSGSSSDAVVAERINGVAVPPLPDPVASAATLAGVDVDGNGVRDDLDRRIATEFGTDPAMHALARDHARRLNAAIVTPGETTRQTYMDTFRCLQDEAMLKRLSDQTRATLDTAPRRIAFAQAMRRLVVSTEGC